MGESKGCYIGFVGNVAEFAIVYIAHSLEEAEEMAWKDLIHYADRREELQVKEQDINVDDLDYGEIDLLEGVKRGAYAWVYAKCPECGKRKKISMSDEFDQVMCSDCEDKLLDRVVCA